MATRLTIHGLQGNVTAGQVLPLTPPLVQLRVGVHEQGETISVKDLALVLFGPQAQPMLSRFSRGICVDNVRRADGLGGGGDRGSWSAGYKP